MTPQPQPLEEIAPFLHLCLLLLSGLAENAVLPDNFVGEITTDNHLCLRWQQLFSGTPKPNAHIEEPLGR